MTPKLSRRIFLAGSASALATSAWAERPLGSIRPVARFETARPAPVPSQDILKAVNLDADIGFAIMDLGTGLIVDQHQSKKMMPPASVTKAMTAGFALNTLGASYKFETKVLVTGDIVDHVLKGDLVLVGGGDPGLETDGIADLVEQISALGIWRIEGQFLVTADGFAHHAQIDPGQPPQVGYNPSVSGLNLNYNRIRFDWAKRQNGKGYRKTMRAIGTTYNPDIPLSHMVLSDRKLPVYDHQSATESEIWSVATHALGDSGGRWMPTRVPRLYAGEAFRGIARTFGMEIPVPKIVDIAPEGQVVATVESSIVQDIAQDMLKYSTNLTAEVLGFASSRETEFKTSAEKLNGWCRTHGMDAAFKDHSGLSHESRVSSNGLVAFMASHSQTQLPEILKDMTDKLGDPGKDAMTKLKAKTGSLNFVSTMSGYLQTPDRNFAFAILCANQDRRAQIKPDDRERPAGSGYWAQRARVLQYRLLKNWLRLS